MRFYDIERNNEKPMNSSTSEPSTENMKLWMDALKWVRRSVLFLFLTSTFKSLKVHDICRSLCFFAEQYLSAGLSIGLHWSGLRSYDHGMTICDRVPPLGPWTPDLKATLCCGWSTGATLLSVSLDSWPIAQSASHLYEALGGLLTCHCRTLLVGTCYTKK